MELGSNASFHSATFHGDARFNGARFGGVAQFTNSSFRNAWFEGATLGTEASFVGAKFGGTARFDRATFGNAWFMEAEFDGLAQFEGTIFKDIAFSKATFGDLVRFPKVKVTGRSWFDNAIFSGALTFENAEFVGDVFFTGDPAHEGSTGRADTFRGFADFRGAKFGRRANFNNRRFVHGADFRKAVFAVAPELHEVVLHQDTRFDGTQFRDRKGTDEVDAAMAYRTLKLAMANVRATDEEARFHALEQQSLRLKPDTPRLVRLFSRLYEMTADYGQSLALPIFWLSSVFFIFFLLYAWVGGPVMWHEAGSIWSFALQQVFQPFAAFRTNAISLILARQSPLSLACIAAVHSLLTFAFLALFLLALRRRFRLT